jgi:3-hydroxybutyryl-CoA dehydrogenase
LIPLVEVVQTRDTDPGVVARTIAFLTALGKTPVHVKRDVPGFVGNRLQHALWREAFNLVDQGVCDPETVDTVVKSGFGLRLPILGPIENADLVGLDLTLDIHDYLLPRLDPPSQPSPGLRERVWDGRHGMKTGAGFLDWSPERAEDVRQALRAYLVRVTRQMRS